MGGCQKPSEVKNLHTNPLEQVRIKAKSSTERNGGLCAGDNQLSSMMTTAENETRELRNDKIDSTHCLPDLDSQRTDRQNTGSISDLWTWHNRQGNSKMFTCSEERISDQAQVTSNYQIFSFHSKIILVPSDLSLTPT
jgi:hypothetical protein